MAKKLITLALTVVALLTLAGRAAARDIFDNWKDARHKYEKHIEKYHKEMRKAQEELRERDYEDYYEHLEKARGNLRKANAYKLEAERFERYAHRGYRGRIPPLSRDRKHGRTHSRRPYKPTYWYVPERRRGDCLGNRRPRRGITLIPKGGWYFRFEF